MSSLYRSGRRMGDQTDIAGMAFGDLWSQLAIIFMVATAVVMPLLLFNVVSKVEENTRMKEALDSTATGKFAKLLQKDIEDAKKLKVESQQLRETNAALLTEIDAQKARTEEFKEVFLELQQKFDEQTLVVNQQTFLANQGGLRTTKLRKELKRTRDYGQKIRVELTQNYYGMVNDFLLLKDQNSQLRRKVEQAKAFGWIDPDPVVPSIEAGFDKKRRVPVREEMDHSKAVEKARAAIGARLLSGGYQRLDNEHGDAIDHSDQSDQAGLVNEKAKDTRNKDIHSIYSGGPEGTIFSSFSTFSNSPTKQNSNNTNRSDQ